MTGISLKGRWSRVCIGIAVLLSLIVALSYFISSDALRNYMEHKINSKLKGYTVQIGKAYFHPILFSVDLNDLVVTQDSNPNPPVAYIGGLSAGVYWREILRARLVGDFVIAHPRLYINLKNIRKERESKVPFRKKGWQEALESIYPLKINVFKVRDGELTYEDKGPYKPLHLSGINLLATNIRNIRFPDQTYPSPIHVEGKIFEKGKLTMNGQANFLEEPHMGFKTDIDLTDMDLGYFQPITERRNISVRKGTLSVKGKMEYSPLITEMDMKEILIRGVDINYLHLPKTVEEEQKRLEKTAKAVRELSNKPATKLRIDMLKISDSSFGYINRTTDPNYRLFIDHAGISLTNLSNQLVEGPATLKLKGRFMGTGETDITGNFRPQTKSPDFDLNVAIKDTEMAAMSDLFRVFGNFDIKSGYFSFYSELRIKDNTVSGYVKPLFRDMQVYDRRPEKEKSLFHKIYVGLVGGIAKLLENRQRHEVATRAEISGSLENPKTSTWQIIINMIKNAFIKSILPGFEKDVTGQPVNASPRRQDKTEHAN